ncbi:hypothetical protein [Bremerella cremea]|uniref:hypothetical protein n=1 Tax=Bremerella cremea TaxID=1031537 RepID=UPI0031F119CB
MQTALDFISISVVEQLNVLEDWANISFFLTVPFCYKLDMAKSDQVFPQQSVRNHPQSG